MSRSRAGMDDHYRRMEIAKKERAMELQEQELITVTQEETKRTEEREEAGYRSPT